MKFFFLFLISMSAFGKDSANDITSFRKMFGDETYPLIWEETTADDGKPLVVTIQRKIRKSFLNDGII